VRIISVTATLETVLRSSVLVTIRIRVGFYQSSFQRLRFDLQSADVLVAGASKKHQKSNKN